MHAALGASCRRMARELLSESVTLGLAGGVFGLAARLRRHSGDPVGRRRRTAARWTRSASTRWSCSSRSASRCSRACCSGSSRCCEFGTPNIAGAEGRRPAVERRPRASSRAQRAGGRGDRARRGAAGLSGLMIRTFLAMRRVDPGFTRPEEVLTFRISIPESVVSKPSRRSAPTSRSPSAWRRSPASPGSAFPPASPWTATTATIRSSSKSSRRPRGRCRRCAATSGSGEGYVETMGNQMVAGRALTWSDVHEHAPLPSSTRTFAREYWKEPAAAIGKRIRQKRRRIPWRKIVGVVGDERDDGVARPAPTIVYWPLLHGELLDGERVSAQRTSAYVVRTGRAGFADAARRRSSRRCGR